MPSHPCPLAAALLPPLLLLAACTPSTTDSAPPSAWPDGCVATGVGAGEQVVSIEIDSNEQAPTVFSVEWEAGQESSWELWLGSSDTYGQVIAPEVLDETSQRAVLKGLRTDAEYHWMLVGTAGEEQWCTEDFLLETPSLNPQLPVFTVSNLDKAGVAGGYFVASLFMRDATWPVIFDSEGEIVWYHPAEANFSYRALLSADKQAVLYMTDGTTPEDEGVIHRVAVDGRSHDEIPVPGCHRDFVEVAPGVYGTLSWEIRSFEHDGETRYLLGDLLVEVEEGEEPRVIWNAFESVVIDFDVAWPKIYVPDPNVEDWLHVNGLFYDSAEEAYYLSVSNLDAVHKIDRASGETRWVLGGSASDFRSSDTTPLLQGPHSIDILDGSLLVFNRGLVIVDEEVEDLGPYSEVVEIALDVEALTASTVWRWGASREYHNNFLGDAVRLPNGNTMVDFSAYGELDQVTPEGELVLTINTDITAAFGFIQYVESLY